MLRPAETSADAPLPRPPYFDGGAPTGSMDTHAVRKTLLHSACAAAATALAALAYFLFLQFSAVVLSGAALFFAGKTVHQLYLLSTPATGASPTPPPSPEARSSSARRDSDRPLTPRSVESRLNKLTDRVDALCLTAGGGYPTPGEPTTTLSPLLSATAPSVAAGRMPSLPGASLSSSSLSSSPSGSGSFSSAASTADRLPPLNVSSLPSGPSDSGDHSSTAP